MAYKRTYRKRAYRKRRQVRRKVPSNKNLAKKIRTLQRKEELKYIDAYSTGSVDNSTGILFTNVPGRGTSINQRVGDVVYPTSLQLCAQFKSNANNASTVQIRCVVFWDSQPNGNVPTLLGSPSPTVPPVLDTATVTDPTFAPHCLQSMKRYKIIYDKILSLTPNIVTVSNITNNLTATATDTSATVNVVSKNHKVYRKLNRVIKYAANAVSYTDIVTNCLWIAFISDQAANSPTVEYGARMYYKDA